MKKIIVLVSVSILLSLAIVSGLPTPVVADPAEIVVPDDYAKIQWAIGNASDGDTIFVRAGTYYEHVTMNKSVSLIGENSYNTIIDGGGTGTVIYITANDTKISGFTIQNSGATSVDSGIYLSHDIGRNNISYNIITHSYYGIQIFISSNNTFIGNNVTSNQIGTYLTDSHNNVFVSNNFTNNEGGFYLDSSSNNTLVGNIMLNNHQNFGVSGESFFQFNNHIDTSNTVNGKPIYYIIGAANVIYDAHTNAGTIYLINSYDILVKDLTLTKNLFGAFLWNTTDSKIENVTVTNNSFGIELQHSSKIVLFSNNAESNVEGIQLASSNNNILVGNNVMNNSELGINLPQSSSSNIIGSNKVSDNGGYGIQVLYNSNKNIFVANNISKNKYPGISVACDNNSVYHNNFVNNGQDFVEGKLQVWSFQGNNTWDDGYPSGGNYWSDYIGMDAYCGPDQDIPGSDGIGDTPYVINTINKDRYPLMNSYVLPDKQLLYYELLANFTELQSKYNNLVESYKSLQAQLNNLQSKYDALTNELNTTRNIMYALLTVTIVLIAATAYFKMRKPKGKQN
jgi:parallel beta-helix repeat protein